MKDGSEVQFLRSDKAKYLRISLKTTGEVIVTVPQRTTIEEAKNFVETKKDWIDRNKAKMAANEIKKTIFTPETVFSIRNRHLHMQAWKSEQFRAQRTKDSLKIFYPQNIDILSENAQKTVRRYIVDAIREEAKEYLPFRTKELAAQHGLSFQRVTVKNITSRWGSCSSKNNINLNIHLVRLPDYLSDYVIFHELAHTIHKNHQKKFWEYLDSMTNGTAKLLAHEIRQIRLAEF